MNIGKFVIAELFNNTKGKTSLSMLCAFILTVTGCSMGLKSAFTMSGEIALQGLGYATLGASLLGLRRFTKDKEIPAEASNPDC